MKVICRSKIIINSISAVYVCSCRIIDITISICLLVVIYQSTNKRQYWAKYMFLYGATNYYTLISIYYLFMSDNLLGRLIVLLTAGVYASNHEVLCTIVISITRRFQKSVGPSVRHTPPYIFLIACTSIKYTVRGAPLLHTSTSICFTRIHRYSQFT